jgi:hypothetical protein
MILSEIKEIYNFYLFIYRVISATDFLFPFVSCQKKLDAQK